MKGKTILLAATFLLAASAVAVTAADVFHFALSRSVPAADATVPTPTEVRLVFTQVPQAGSVSIRLVNRAGQAVPATDPAADPEFATAYLVKPAATLAVGPYTVSWRGIGDDGHVVTGNFGFSVAAQ